MKPKFFFIFLIFLHLQMGGVHPSYAQDQEVSSDLRDLFANTEVSLETPTSRDSIFLSDPAIASYFALGAAAIFKTYFNWLRKKKSHRSRNHRVAKDI